MYNNIESTVLNNGNTGNYFKLERGVRQGCLLSAYLFIQAMEVLANKICNDIKIKGIKINKKEIKINPLADDITLIVKDIISLENTLNTLKNLQNCSGLKININKTKAKYIGKILKPDHFPRGLLWIKTPLQPLGIFITNDPDKYYLLNYKLKLAELKNLLNIWKQRALSLKGKITIINTLALVPLIYVASIIDIPKNAITEVNNIIHHFIWDGKHPKLLSPL